MTNVFIDGGHGTTGLAIHERLSNRDDIELIKLSEAQRRDISARRMALNDADIAILCLPDDAAVESVSLIQNPRTRVIDASTAHRTHPDWFYGFHEIFPFGLNQLQEATRVSNPGCYPTGFLAVVVPLLQAGLVSSKWPLTVNAVSGYSGGGKAMIAEFETGVADTAWRTYAMNLAHKHVPEMQVHSGLFHPPQFSPSVANIYCGMVVDVPLMTGAMAERPSANSIRDTLINAYAGSPVVSVVENVDEAHLTIERCANSDRLELHVLGNKTDTQVRLVAILDNLGKGAAGAAVQSLNIMTGAEETKGLRV